MRWGGEEQSVIWGEICLTAFIHPKLGSWSKISASNTANYTGVIQLLKKTQISIPDKIHESIRGTLQG